MDNNSLERIERPVRKWKRDSINLRHPDIRNTTHLRKSILFLLLALLLNVVLLLSCQRHDAVQVLALLAQPEKYRDRLVLDIGRGDQSIEESLERFKER
jgi:hypothetical protein